LEGKQYVSTNSPHFNVNSCVLTNIDIRHITVLITCKLHCIDKTWLLMEAVVFRVVV